VRACSPSLPATPITRIAATEDAMHMAARMVPSVAPAAVGAVVEQGLVLWCLPAVLAEPGSECEWVRVRMGQSANGSETDALLIQRAF